MINKEVVYQPSQIKIDITEKERLNSEELDNKRHGAQITVVSNFISSFKQKYSRKPSIDEILSNLTNIKMIELRIILDELQLN